MSKKKDQPKKSAAKKVAGKSSPQKNTLKEKKRAVPTHSGVTKKAPAKKSTTRKTNSSVTKAKSSNSKSAGKKTSAKKAPAKTARKTTAPAAPKKAAVKKAPAKKAAAKKTAARKPAARKTLQEKAAATKTANKAATNQTAAKKKFIKKESADKAATRSAPAKARPIAFSLEEARKIASNRSAAAKEVARKKASDDEAAAAKKSRKLQESKPAARVLGAASLSDILGRNPKAEKSHIDVEKKEVPKKFLRYFNLLIELRQHVLSELDLHTKDTLKRSSKEDSGNLSGYGQHMADAGTDSFDRDFALSLVSTEQEALSEIEAAIDRIHNGTYGTCEITGKPIAKERLLAVPFARYSVEGQAEYEKNLKRPSQRGGAYLDSGNEGGDFLTEDPDE